MTSKPIAVSDCHDPKWYWTQAEIDWLNSYDIDPDITWRYEVYVIDMPFAKVFQHDKHNRLENGDIHRYEIIVPLTSLPEIEKWRPNEAGH